MEPAPPETKRPRLSTGSWSTGTPQHGVSLPHPTSHLTAHGPYQPQHPYSRPPDPPPAPAQHHPDDRRQHEPEFYAPMQDPHRQPPPPSPAHPPYPPPYATRDPVVKRDPGEETPLPHLRRPNSTGNVVDGLPPGPHGPPPHLAQHPEDPRRPMSFDNGPPMAPSPTLYRPPPPSYPPTPVPHHPQYEGGPVYGHPPPPNQSIYPAQLEIQSAKRKAQRASQACDSCRQLKAKCDETKPCKNCKEKGVKCNYREPTVKQPDKATADILELLAFMKDEMTSGFAAMKKLEQRVSGMESVLRRLNADTKMESVEGDDDRHDMILSSPAFTSKEEADDSASSPTATLVGPSLTEAQQTLQGIDDDMMEDPPGPPVEPGRPAMPPIHTTLAGLLLKWGPISRMVHTLLEAEKIRHVEEFPIRQEMQRGMIRVFGFGEGFDQEIRAVEFANQADHAMTDVHDDYSDIASPAPLGEVWGQLGGLGPSPGLHYKGGVINMEGNPDYDPAKVWEYVQSFKDHILNMHPIIIPKELDAMVKLFLETLPSAKPKQPKTSASAKFLNQPASSIPPFAETGTKRKRSPAADEPNPGVPFQKPGRPYRSIHSALVLLVLALGKICLHRDPIPDVVRESPEMPSANSPLIRNGFPVSPLQGSPPGLVSQSQSSGLPSPREIERGLPSRRPSVQGAAQTAKGISIKRNFDVIPGLEYFALATDIIGSHIGGHNLKHVYVLILAGLYHGQLGRIIESWSYINLASTRLHAILRPSLKRLSRLKEETKSISTRRDNQLAFAFWTCLQLESDILAELPLAQSPIMQHEDQMPYPNLVLANSQGFSERVLQGYSAQLYLRKKLNQVHNLLYDQRRSEDPRQMVGDPEVESGIRSIQTELRDARNIWVPKDYKWNEDEPPAPDILSARLRAKYWGSQVIIYRLYIRAILELDGSTSLMLGGRPPQPEDWASMGLDFGGPNNVDPRILNFARLGIHALIESTRAFHGLDSSQRLIITNVFGTAHAQWGNLIILAACFKDPLLSKFIDPDLLSDLFTRTIRFFDMVALPSSALMADRNILVGLARDLDLVKPDEFDPRASSSFSSAASGGPLPPMQNPGDNYIPSSPAVYAPSHFAPPPHHLNPER